MRYEIALEVESGCIVWAYGGFPAGMRDIDIAKRKFIKQLKKGEKAVADKGYRFCKRFFVPKTNYHLNGRIKQILARHENVNRRIKSFDCMSEMLRHDLSLHHVYFHAVVNIVQIAIENGEKLPDVSPAYKL